MMLQRRKLSRITSHVKQTHFIMKFKMADQIPFERAGEHVTRHYYNRMNKTWRDQLRLIIMSSESCIADFSLLLVAGWFSTRCGFILPYADFMIDWCLRMRLSFSAAHHLSHGLSSNNQLFPSFKINVSSITFLRFFEFRNIITLLWSAIMCELCVSSAMSLTMPGKQHMAVAYRYAVTSGLAASSVSMAMVASNKYRGFIDLIYRRLSMPTSPLIFGVRHFKWKCLSIVGDILERGYCNRYYIDY